MADAEAIASIRQELAKLPPIPDLPTKEEKKGFFSKLFKKKPQSQPKAPEGIEDFLSKLKQEDLKSMREGEAKRSGTSLPLKGPIDDDFIEAMPEPFMKIDNDRLPQLEADFLKDMRPEDIGVIPPKPLDLPAQDVQKTGDAQPLEPRPQEPSQETVQENTIQAPTLRVTASELPETPSDTADRPSREAPDRPQREIPEKGVRNWKQLKMREKKLLQKERMLIRRAEIVNAKARKIDEKVKRIEADKLDIETREEEVIDLVAALEKDREAIDQRITALHKVEQSIKQKKEAIDRQDHEIAARELELKDIERRNRDTEADIAEQRAALEREAKELDRKRNDLKADLAKVEEAKRKYSKIDEREMKLKEKEIAVKEAAVEIERFKSMQADIKRMEETHQRLKERISEDWKRLAGMHTRQPPTAVPDDDTENGALEEEESDGETEDQASLTKISVSEVDEMIAKVQELMKARQFDLAGSEVRKLMDMYNAIPDSVAEKKQIYYRILNLRNDVKLSAF